jgi:hypothetical protein
VSYDLRVYSQESLSRDSLRELVMAAGLAVEHTNGDTEALMVVRGAKGRYCFTLGLPVAVEVEDVPEEVTAVLLAPAFMYELLVEGSSPTETPHAVRFARRLAQACSGVVLDQQTGQTWARGQLRTPPAAQPGLIDVMEVDWYVRGDSDRRNAARAWLDLTRRYLPEALPRRFGTYEPLPMKFSADDPGAFIDAVCAADGSLFFKASSPCIEGSITGGTRTWQVVSHNLSFHREALRNLRWRDALRRLFLGFAVETDAFFAVAQVQRGLQWSGRTVWFGPEAEKTVYLAARGAWAGLLPYPPWWAWFGPEYAPLVAGHLSQEQVRSVGDGLFHWRSEEPKDRDELIAAISVPMDRRAIRAVRRLLSRRGSEPVAAAGAAWLPPDLLATVDYSDPHLYNPPLFPARTRPAALS